MSLITLLNIFGPEMMIFIIPIVGIIIPIYGIVKVVSSNLSGGIKALYIISILIFGFIGVIVFLIFGNKKDTFEDHI